MESTPDISGYKNKNKEKKKVREMKNFDEEKFVITSENKLCNLFVNNTFSVNKLFTKFFAIFVDVVHDFASIRKTTCKEKKLKQKSLITSNL